MPSFDIEEFLRDENNLDIYDSVSRRKICKTDEELDWFLGLVTDNVKFVNENKNTPRSTSRKVKEVAESLPTYFKQQFYEILIKFLCNQYDQNIASCLQLIHWDYMSYGIEFSKIHEFGLFLPDSTFNNYNEDLINFKLGQGVHYEENGQTFINQWALNSKLKEDKSPNKAPTPLKEENAEDNSTAKSSNPSPMLVEWQQALFFHYLRKVHKIGAGVDDTVLTKVLAQVLGKNLNPTTRNMALYKYLNKPFGKIKEGERSFVEAVKKLQQIRSLFLSLGDIKTVEIIDLDINDLEDGKIPR